MVALYALASGSLLVCSIVNFPVSVVFCALTAWHLLGWWLARRARGMVVGVLLVALLDPVLLAWALSHVVDDAPGLAGSPLFAFCCVVYIPFHVVALASMAVTTIRRPE